MSPSAPKKPPPFRQVALDLLTEADACAAGLGQRPAVRAWIGVLTESHRIRDLPGMRAALESLRTACEAARTTATEEIPP